MQGYTNKGNIMGDWIGREGQGRASVADPITSPETSGYSLNILRKKTPGEFVPLGTTQNQFKVSLVKRFGPDVELKSWLQYGKDGRRQSIEAATNEHVSFGPADAVSGSCSISRGKPGPLLLGNCDTGSEVSRANARVLPAVGSSVPHPSARYVRA